MNLQSIQALALSVITVVGLIVLIAMGKVATSDALPIIALLAGAHVGISAQSSTTPATTTPTVTTPPIQ